MILSFQGVNNDPNDGHFVFHKRDHHLLLEIVSFIWVLHIHFSKASVLYWIKFATLKSGNYFLVVEPSYEKTTVRFLTDGENLEKAVLAEVLSSIENPGGVPL